MTNSGAADPIRAALAAFEEGKKTLAELETVLAAALQSGLLTPAVAMEVLGKPVAAGVVAADTLMRLGLSNASDGTALRSPEPSSKSGQSAEGQLAPSDSQSNESISPRLPNEPISTGQLLGGRYRLERKLGEGGMGVVYLASDQEVRGEIFAIKVLTPEIRERPDALELLREEVRKTRALAHPNIVGVYSLNVDRSDVFILMECLEGKTLQALLDEDFGRGMPFDRAWPIIADVGAALVYAHDHSVIHGDLKPANVFVTTSGKAKLLDFGIARAARGPRRAKDAAVLGALTPAYASCEMLEQLEPDARDDIYAFAGMIYEMLSGRHPFGGRTAVEARDKGEKPIPIERLTGRQNAALVQGLAFDRTARTATVEALIAGLAPGVDAAKRRIVPSMASWVAALSVASAVTLAYFVVDKFWLSKHVAAEHPTAQVIASTASAAPAISDKSVAVLPFVDMSEKKDQEYFSDGLSEELIDMLTKVPDLRVPARTSSFYFKGKSEDIPTIARRLMVAHVLEGSVRKSGMNLRITAQLVRADNGYHVWSQTYDRKLDDIFKVQDEIAGAVVAALKVSLGDSSALKVTTPKNTEAYTLYLQGRAINRNAGNKAQFDSAAEYMRKAIKADPTFAEAWAWLAQVLGNEVGSYYVSAEAVGAEMRDASQRALALDPNLADAHMAKGQIYLTIDWDWEAALAEFQKAYDLDPTDANTARNLGISLFNLHGESGTVLALLQKAIELDPVNPHCYAFIGSYYMETDKLPEAETAYRRAIDLLPTGQDLHVLLGTLLLLRGEAATALAEFRRDPDESNQRQGAAMAYYALGRKAEADAVLSEMERLDATTNADGIAETHALRGEIDQAFAWLDRAYQQRDFSLSVINRDPLMKSLHGDPRWKAFLHKMKLPE
jgi:serine/threonine-protein kinase